MLVSDLMHPVEYIVKREDDLQIVAVYLKDRQCRALPMVDGRGRVIAIITPREVLAAVAATRRPLWDIGVGEIEASTAFGTCASSADAHDAVGCMQRSRLRCLVALSTNNQVVGIVGPVEVLAHTSVNDGAASFAAAEAVRLFKRACL